MMYLQNELFHTSKNEHIIDTHYHMDKLKSYVEGKKPEAN